MKGKNIIKNLRRLSVKSKELEILLQIFQTNLQAAYKYLSIQNYNKLNDLITNIKVKKEQERPTSELSQSQNKFLSHSGQRIGNAFAN